MGWTEKFAVGLAFFGVVLMGVFIFLVYDANSQYNSLHEDLKESRTEISQLETKLEYQRLHEIENNALLNEELKLAGEKIALLEESIDPKNFRWAKTKKVRDAILKTIEEESLPKYMSTVDLTYFSGYVVEWAEQYDVPIPLILAVCRKESAFNPKAKSHAGALGAMQVMPSTAKNEIALDLGIRAYNLYRARDSVRFGTYYLRKMMDQFDGDVGLAVRAYNCGPTCVRRVVAGEYENYPKETRGYARMILGNEEIEGFIKYYERMGLE